MDRWEYQNLQFKTVPSAGVWSKISEYDLGKLEKFQSEGWDPYQIVNIRGSLGFSSHILFILRKKN